MSPPWPYRLNFYPPQRKGRIDQIRAFAEHFTRRSWRTEETSAGTASLLLSDEADFRRVLAWLKVGHRADEGRITWSNLITGDGGEI